MSLKYQENKGFANVKNNSLIIRNGDPFVCVFGHFGCR